MIRTGETSIASSAVRDMHRLWTRPMDAKVFVYCTLTNGRCGWATMDSLQRARPDLSARIEAGNWDPKPVGQRLKAKPHTDRCTWFHVVHPDEPPPPPLPPPQPPSLAFDAATMDERLRNFSARMHQLETHCAQLWAYVHAYTSSLPAVSNVPTHALPADDEGTSASFDLDAFVAQHSFSDVDAPHPSPAPSVWCSSDG